MRRWKKSVKLQAWHDMKKDQHDRVAATKVRMPLIPTVNSHPIFSRAERDRAVDRVKIVLRTGKASPFEHEGDCRHGLRSQLCLNGNRFALADAEAAEIVEQALHDMGVRRPSVEEAQPGYAAGEDYCRWCWSEIPEELKLERVSTHYCSRECARSARVYREFDERRSSDVAYMAAINVIERTKLPARRCQECGKKFRPGKPDQVFCSHDCWASNYRRPDRQCETCGTTFHPHTDDSRFCSIACAGVARRQAPVRTCLQCGTEFRRATGTQKVPLYCSKSCADEALRHKRITASCHYCGAPFEAGSARAKFCSDACSQADSKSRRGWQPSVLTRATFDHFVTMPVNDAIPHWMVERFDELVAA